MQSTVQLSEKDVLKIIHEELSSVVRNGKPLRSTVGICNSIELDIVSDKIGGYSKASGIVSEIIKRWPERSADTAYPVKSTFQGFSNCEAYWHAKQRRVLWSNAHPYGKARWRLLHFILSELETMINA